MLRFACPRTAAALLICSMGFVAHASAQEFEVPSLRKSAETFVVPPAQIPAAVTWSLQRRPGALVPLYVSFGALQVLDTHSTSRAIDRGAVEANPVMKGIVGNPIGMLAVKSAGTAGVIYVSEKMWKRNKTAAIIFMIATNSAMTWVVQNNYRAAR